jgi:predicted TPR repeat methyltransferase
MKRSSGDLIVDRRYEYAVAAAMDGDWRACAEILEQAIERAPDWAPAWLALGEAREKRGDVSGAAEAYVAAAALDRDDQLGAGPRLARLQGISPTALPIAYVRTLFDDYAPRFARHLIEALAYQGPALICEALGTVASNRRFSDAIDLGCGDGLAGEALRPRVDRLTGVDLSAAMIERARTRGLYDRLEVDEICAFLGQVPPDSADLILAADVLPYIGALTRLFEGVGRALAPNGLFACTAEGEAGEGFQLAPGLRFAHSDKYLVGQARAEGLSVRALQSRAARRENGDAAPGWVIVFAREAP